MKKALPIFLCVLFGLTLNVQLKAQMYRYEDRIFDEIQVTSDITYSNAPALNNKLSDFVALFGMTIEDYNIHIGESGTANVDLKMDLYQPSASDTVLKRPAIVFVHGGTYLFGSKNSDDMVALCDSFAHLGYVAASIDYRTGIGCKFDVVLFPALATTVTISGENSIRAGYRVVQDLNAAVSFLRANADSYGIDPERIYILGSDAGANTALSNIYLDKAEEIPDAVRAFDDGGDLGDPDAYCQDGYSPKALAVASLWGAMVNVSIIDDETTPVLLVHGQADTLVNFKEGYPLAGSASSEEGTEVVINIPATFGSYCVDTALNNRGISHETYFPEEVGHEFYGTTFGMFEPEGPNAYWDTVYVKVKDFLHDQLGPDTDFSYFRKGLTVDLRTLDSYGSGSEIIHWEVDGNSYDNVTRVSYTAGSEGPIEVTLSITLQDGFTSTVSKTIYLWYSVGDYDPEFTTVPDENGILYVSEDGNGNGSSWEEALGGFYLQNALFDENASEVQLAAGTYYPVYNLMENNELLYDKTFLINSSKKVLGARYIAEAPPVKSPAHPYSILSGNLGSYEEYYDNASHVVTCEGAENEIMLDSLMITDGYSLVVKSTTNPDGAALLATSNIKITNCAFNSNKSLNGGAISSNGGKIEIINSVFNKNTCGINGGAIYMDQSDVVIDNCLFYNNLGGYGGAVALTGGTLQLSSSTLVLNAADMAGGALYASGSASAQVNNTVIWGNTGVDDLPDQIATDNGTIDLSYSAVEGGYAGVAVMTLAHDNLGTETALYPGFQYPDLANFRLGDASALINHGSNPLVINMTDLDGKPRISDGSIDIGAYEYQLGTLTYRIVFITDEYTSMLADTIFVEAGANTEAILTPTEGYNFVAYVNGVEMEESAVVDNGDGTFLLKFTAVNENLTVDFTTSIKVMTITTVANDGGFVTPTSLKVNYGSSAKFMLVPDQNYEITSVVLYDNEMLGDLIKEGGHYNLIIDEVKADGVLNIAFSVIQGVNGITIGKLNLYPNPAGDQLYVDLQDINARSELTLTNLYGQVILQLSDYSGSGIDVSSLQEGCYLISIKSAGAVYTGMFLKK